MKLKLKLPLAFGCLLALLLAAALFGIRMLHGSLVTFDTVVQRHMANERAVNQLDSGFRTQVQEWKNTLLRGREPELLARYWEAFQKEERAVADGAARLRDALPAGEARTLVASFAEAHARMGEGYRRGHAAFVAAGFDPVAGDRAVRGMDREPAKLLDEAGRRIAAESAATAQQASRDGRAAIWLSLGVMLAVSALGIGVSVAVSRMIVRPIDRAVRVAQAVAGGDLTAEVSSPGQDETAQLLNALGVMQAQLTQLVRHVRASAEGVASASSEIAQGNNDLSARTEQQAAALQQTAASMEELGAAVRLNADSSQAANQLAQDASAIAEQGGRVVGDVVETMRGIQGSSQRIAEITSVIDGIAFQTNILALNASVEAARAGEQGLGFAVVAGEVRQLAQRSAEAAREIKTLIGSSAERVERGTVLVDQAGSTMSGVVDAIRRVSTVVGEISTATREQSSGVSQIGQAVAQMDQATQRNAALVEECAAAAEGLRQRAAQLVQAVAVFRLPQGTG